MSFSSGSKPWYESKTIAGAVVALIGAVLSWLKYSIDVQALDDVAGWVTNVMTLIGAGTAIWGRIRASKAIAPKTPPTDPPTRTLGLLLLLLFIGVALAGCGCSPAAGYVQADRATYQAVAGEYGAYVALDPKLDPSQKARRARTIETWNLRLEQAEKAQAADPFGVQGSASIPAQPGQSVGEPQESPSSPLR